jgi:micrococcal nuclease
MVAGAFIMRCSIVVVPPIMALKLHHRKRPAHIPEAARSNLAPFSGKVFRFPDGDGLQIITPGGIVPVRLAGLDAPEWGQPYAKQSWLFLQSAIWGHPAEIFPESLDKYGRIVAEVFGIHALSVNLLSVFFGFSWYYHRYAPERSDLRDAQRLAQMNKRGLWKYPAPVAPWAYRHRKPTKGC